jgi:hypothetical protein
MKYLAAGAAVALLAAGPCRAQELWDPSFNLICGSTSGAEDASLGRNLTYGLSMMGAYPVLRKGSVVFEFGYDYLPPLTLSNGNTAKSNGYFGGLMFRHEVLFDGLYLQGGVRAHQMKTKLSASDGTSVTGPRVSSVRPVIGIGYDFDGKYTLDLNACGLAMKNNVGMTKNATMVELSLGIHLGK